MPYEKIITLLLAVLLFPFTVYADTSASNAIDMLNSLLRGELSAVETYRQTLEKIAENPDSNQLRAFHADHQSAVVKLKEQIESLGGVASTDSGAWGTWANTVQGTAELFGDASALKALKEGEEHGLKRYQEVLHKTDISGAVKTLLRDELIMNQQKHIVGLDMYIAKT